jgi:hypothetical protein
MLAGLYPRAARPSRPELRRRNTCGCLRMSVVVDGRAMLACTGATIVGAPQASPASHHGDAAVPNKPVGTQSGVNRYLRQGC